MLRLLFAPETAVLSVALFVAVLIYQAKGPISRWRVVAACALILAYVGCTVYAGQIIIQHPCCQIEAWSWEWILLGCWSVTCQPCCLEGLL